MIVLMFKFTLFYSDGHVQSLLQVSGHCESDKHSYQHRLKKKIKKCFEGRKLAIQRLRYIMSEMFREEPLKLELFV